MGKRGVCDHLGVGEIAPFQGLGRDDPEGLEVDPMVCPKYGGTMKVVAFITEYAVVDRIIDHMKLTFAAAKPPPCNVFEHVALTAAEESGEYF